MGRFIQAAAGSAGWIVGFATLTDNVRPEHVGKVLGTAMSFVAAGVIMGPMIAGALLQLLGYWAAWSSPFILLGMDFVARLLMIGKNDTQSESSEDASSDENETLLPRNFYNSSDPEQGCTELTGPGFYRIVLCNIRIIVALLNTFMFSVILSGFDATLPLHLQKIFNWGSLPIGMIFLGIQVPGMILGPVVGWLRDREGLRYPTTIGWVLIAPLMCALGLPGTGIDWLSHGDNGKIFFIGGIIAIGAVAPLVRGAGTFQLIGKDKILLPCDTILTIKKLSPMTCKQRSLISSGLTGAAPESSPSPKSHSIWDPCSGLFSRGLSWKHLASRPWFASWVGLSILYT